MSEIAERVAAWREGKIPVAELAHNRAEREKQFIDGKCGYWCLDRKLFAALLRLGVIDANGFITARGFTGTRAGNAV